VDLLSLFFLECRWHFILTSAQHFVTVPAKHLAHHGIDASLTSGMHNSKRACVLMADSFERAVIL